MTQRISAWRTPLAAQIDAAGLPSDPLPLAPRCRALALCHLPLSVTMRKNAGYYCGGHHREMEGKACESQMATIGRWKNGVMGDEYLFWHNQEFMKQIGLGK